MELWADHQLLEAGEWNIVIHQVLFCASWQEYGVREVIAATQDLHCTQVRVLALLHAFSRVLSALDLHTLYLVMAMYALATLQVFPLALGGPLSGPGLVPLKPLAQLPLTPHSLLSWPCVNCFVALSNPGPPHPGPLPLS